MGVVTVSDLVSKRTNKLHKSKKVKEDKVVDVDEFQRSRQSLSTEEIRENDRIKEEQEELKKKIKSVEKVNDEISRLNTELKEDYELLKKQDVDIIAELNENIALLKKETEVRNRNKKDK